MPVAENIDPNVALLMFIPYRAMENRVVAALDEAGFGGMTVAQRRLFQRIGHKGTRLTDLAEQAQVTKQAAGFLVDQLERDGFVERAPDPADGRARLVCYSERGTKLVELATAAGTEVEQEWTEYLGERDMAQLRRLLTKLREITDPYQ
nr:MarR family winged helix-turn-helix transcriptional regulator [Antrihabitans sp. YC2-6]